jgi:predicted PurR-regulated permease PerM
MRKRSWNIRSVAIAGLFVLALFYTLHVARAFFLPVTLAVLLSFLFNPMVRWFHRRHVRPPAGAALVLSALLAALVCGALLLSGPAEEWLAKAPETLRQLEARARQVLQTAAKLGAAAEQVQQMTKGGPPDATPKVQVKPPSWGETMLTWTGGIVAGTVVTLVLLYFLLASGDTFIRKLAKLLRLEQKTRAAEIAREIEHHISKYLLTITIINCCLGATVGLAMFFIGLPHPVLWGVMAALLNFIPYFGPLTGCLVLALAALMQSEAWGHLLLPPAVYLCLHGIEANLITPIILGRHLVLNPLAAFVSLVFWGWFWGVAGALMAVPILTTFRIVCDHIEPLAPIDELLRR